MKRRRQKSYWAKKSETYLSGREAKSRAGALRTYEHVQHVVVEKAESDYVVRYSIAKWFLEDCQRAGVKL